MKLNFLKIFKKNPHENYDLEKMKELGFISSEELLKLKIWRKEGEIKELENQLKPKPKKR